MLSFETILVVCSFIIVVLFGNRIMIFLSALCGGSHIAYVISRHFGADLITPFVVLVFFTIVYLYYGFYYVRNQLREIY
ncbi:hypothetical protein ASD24_24485 [Paenibacillus sp. Root52]|nr:hypothetical protein ASD24_24485 [Paenibacillus sp. Root52]